MLKSLKTKAEVATDVTTTAEVQEVSEATEIRAENAEVVAEVSAQEKKADSEVKEVPLREKVVSEVKEVQTDQEEKAALQDVNRVLFKEKKERQDVLKAMRDRPGVHLKRLKAEDREKANAFKSHKIISKYQ